MNCFNTTIHQRKIETGGSDNSSGPGENIVLRTIEGDAVFVWRKFIDDSGQSGINCAVFVNKSLHKSSELIRQADAIADFVWPGQRRYTYVNASGYQVNESWILFSQSRMATTQTAHEGIRTENS